MPIIKCIYVNIKCIWCLSSWFVCLLWDNATSFLHSLTTEWRIFLQIYMYIYILCILYQYTTIEWYFVSTCRPYSRSSINSSLSMNGKKAYGSTPKQQGGFFVTGKILEAMAAFIDNTLYISHRWVHPLRNKVASFRIGIDDNFCMSKNLFSGLPCALTDGRS